MLNEKNLKQLKFRKYKKGKFENGQKLNKIIFFKLKILKNRK